MTAWIVVAVVLLACPTSASADCGTERAAVKLGLDSDAARVTTEPRSTTIAALSALPRPHTARRAPAELQVWRVTATLIAYRAEADGDYHLVISDGRRTMIVEIPSPRCAAHGAWAKQIAKARAAADRMQPGKKLRRIAVQVTVTGVGFFDRDHGQLGAARNGIELHPLLSVEFEKERR